MTEAPPAPDLLALAVRLADQGAALARKLRSEAITDIGTKSSDTDVVTAADHAVERLVIDELARLRPGDAVLSEESGSRGEQAGAAVRWILDPIDGTVNYLYGVPYYAVSLAAEVAGIVIAGVVHNAATNERWVAVRGSGAYRGDFGVGPRLAGSAETTLGQSLIATGFGYHPARRRHQAEVLAALADRIRDIRRFGAAALDLCLAAEGLVDGFFEKGLNAWDMAAGALIAMEAGLMVTNIDGGPPDRSFLVAAPPAIHRALRPVLANLDAAGGP
ncbi:MAG TPA: inositol monophosphatase family protein [Micromonosporaceae bacterium]|nr:inositol monophosphatase family protein [Micromonosporaceae bacterium]